MVNRIPSRATHLFKGYKGGQMHFEIWVDADPYGERSGSYQAELAVCKSRLAKGEIAYVDIVSLRHPIGTIMLTKADTKPSDILT